MKLKRLKNKRFKIMNWYNGYYTDYSYVNEVDGREMEFASYEEYLEYIGDDDE